MEDLKTRWKLGDYSTAGYLMEILITMKQADQPIDINNVQQFCDTWDINPRAFYRAKAALVAQGRLKGKYKQILSFDLSR
jgi:phage terminase small subunit